MILELDSSIMDSPAGVAERNDIHGRLAARLRELRLDRGLSLDALAEMAGVSRSMISLVERGESSPTAWVLDRLASGLGVTMASLFAEPPAADASPLSRRRDQHSWRDPQTGYVRRNLSPPGFPSPIELVEVRLPGEARVAYDSAASSRAAINQQIWLIEGRLALTVGGVTHDLHAGDCLAMRLEGPITFHNPTEQTARYVVALVAEPRVAR